MLEPISITSILQEGWMLFAGVAVFGLLIAAVKRYWWFALLVFVFFAYHYSAFTQ